MNIETAFKEWQEGNISASECLEILASNMAGVKDSKGAFEQTEKIIKDYAGRILDHLKSDKAQAGAGAFIWTKPSIRRGWDSKKLEALYDRLSQNFTYKESFSRDMVLEFLDDCRTETPIAGTLQFRLQAEKDNSF